MPQLDDELLNVWRERYSNPELRIQELCRNYDVSIELIKRIPNFQELLDRILLEYIRRFEEIPGKDLARFRDPDFSDFDLEKLRSLVMFATHAVLLKETSEIFRALEEKNYQLEQANRRLQDLNRYYLNMLGFVSHELRSPLITISGFAELLKEQILGPLNEEQKNAAEAIDRSSQSLLSMIQNYLDLARIEQGDIHLTLENVELFSEVIQPVVEDMSEQLARQGMSVKIREPSQSLRIRGDRELLKVVVSNLLSNAIKYGNPQTAIRISATPRGDFVHVAIRNEGKGVRPEDRQRIFEKFVRLETAQNSYGRGAGLGLYNARYIVEKHGGKIWAESRYEHWFKVVFTLPAVGQDEPPKDQNQGSLPEPAYSQAQS